MSDHHAFLAHHFDTIQQQREAQAVGMWMFLATEVLLFGALFVSYTAYRTFYPEAFEAGSSHLIALIGGGNTVVLLTSSLTMAMAVYAAQTGKRRMLVLCLLLTIALGLVFLGVKAVEYWIDYREALVPGLAFDEQRWIEEGVNPHHVALFFSFYYIMTGVHAVHMIGGISVMGVMTFLAYRGRFPKENYMPVEMAGLYWHFVDIVWIFLLPMLYLIGTRHSLW